MPPKKVLLSRGATLRPRSSTKKRENIRDLTGTDSNVDEEPPRKKAKQAGKKSKASKTSTKVGSRGVEVKVGNGLTGIAGVASSAAATAGDAESVTLGTEAAVMAGIADDLNRPTLNWGEKAIKDWLADDSQGSTFPWPDSKLLRLVEEKYENDLVENAIKYAHDGEGADDSSNRPRSVRPAGLRFPFLTPGPDALFTYSIKGKGRKDDIIFHPRFPGRNGDGAKAGESTIPTTIFDTLAECSATLPAASEFTSRLSPPFSPILTNGESPRGGTILQSAFARDIAGLNALLQAAQVLEENEEKPEDET